MADDYIPYHGGVLRTGTLVPPVNTSTLPLLSSAPGFKLWTEQQIRDYVKAKPYRRRQQFSGSGWILNQANRGSCNCAAATGALRRAMTLGGRNEVPQLSWEFLYAQLVDGNDVGSMLDDGMQAIQKVGIPPLDPAKHPLNKHIRKRDYSPEEYAAAKSFVALQCYQTDEKLEMMTALCSMPAAGVVAVHVGSNFTNLDKKGYVGVDRGPGNHAVGVDDVVLDEDGQLALDHFGSWSDKMHDSGYGLLSWERHLAETNRNHKFYVIAAASNPADGGPVVQP